MLCNARKVLHYVLPPVASISSFEKLKRFSPSTGTPQIWLLGYFLGQVLSFLLLGI